MAPITAAENESAVLDYDLVLFNRKAYCGEDVANTIRRRLDSHLSSLLSEEEKSHLCDIANKAHELNEGIPDTDKNDNPLVRYKKKAPLYSTLVSDERIQRENKRVSGLIGLAQDLALFESIHTNLSPNQHFTICNFCHLIPHRRIIDKSLNEFIPTSYEPEEIFNKSVHLKRYINSVSKDARANELASILMWLYEGISHTSLRRKTATEKVIRNKQIHKNEPTDKTASSSRLKRFTRESIQSMMEEHKKHSRKKQKNHPKSARPRTSYPPRPAKHPDDNSDHLEPILTDDPALSPDLNDQSAHALTEHGHRIRLNRLFAGRSSEAFTEIEAFQAMKWLIEFSPKTPAMHAARLIWLLVGLTGRRFDDLCIALLSPSDAEDGDILEITRSGDCVTVKIRHIISSRLATLPSSVTRTATFHDFELSTTIPSNIPIDIAWEFLTNESVNTPEKLAPLLDEKYVMRDILRANLDRFTETRFRGAVIQTVFTEKYDLPFTQLIFSEALDTSLAALHYISWPNHELQSGLNRATTKLFQGLLPYKPAGCGLRIGSAKSALPIEVFSKTRDTFNKAARSLRRLSPNNWTERHNRLSKMAVIALGLGAAHRITAELSALTLDDISLKHGVVIFRDKPSDSSCYRRIAVIPDGAINVLLLYLNHLQTLSKETSALPNSIIESINSSLNAEGPLFWQTDESHTVRPANLKEWLHDLFPNGIPLNVARHFQATQCRALGASPLLVCLTSMNW